MTAIFGEVEKEERSLMVGPHMRLNEVFALGVVVLVRLHCSSSDWKGKGEWDQRTFS